MRVVLAGFNVDAEALGSPGESKAALTPEVISASYARISRDPRGIAALRREARREVGKARASNERIVFGFGHRSIAEHAVLNLDVSGISRLAVEEIEHFRLASYTEKSQRYVRLGRDFVVPREIRGGAAEREFRSLMSDLHGMYAETLRKVAAAGGDPAAAREDARYLMPLATSTQLGMTVNARELEYMIGKLASHPLRELRDFSRNACAAARTVIPSLIRHPEPSAHWLDERAARREISSAFPRRSRTRLGRDSCVRLIDATPRADERLVACILSSSGACSFAEAAALASRLGRAKREAIVARTMRRLGPHDGVWREFESIHFLFELVVSASCFAQLKRHRVATLLPQAYDPSLGISMPKSLKVAGAAGALQEAARRVARFHRAHAKRLGPAVEYAILNAHRRRVLFGLNLRELHHFSRLRSDASAQWEIRELSREMCRLVKGQVPAGARLLCGKDAYEETRRGSSLDR